MQAGIFREGILSVFHSRSQEKTFGRLGKRNLSSRRFPSHPQGEDTGSVR